MMASDSVHGEERIVAEFLAPLAAGFPGALGLEDDCALLTPAPGTQLVLKTDPVVAGLHFFADDDPADIGWKALAVNVSDLAAKGADPVAYLMALSLPQAPTRDWMARFAQGLGDAQAAFGIALAGGDTDRTPGHLAITITVIGSVSADSMVRRATASSGHVAYVSGTLGCAALGLRLRRDPVDADRLGLDKAAREAALSRYLRPQPRLGLRHALRSHAAAAMDLSDGLIKDLGRMCRASGVGAVVHADRMPVSTGVARMLSADPARIADVVAAGDDYEVLAAVPRDRAAAFEADARAAGVAVTAVGTFEDGQGVRLLDAAGHEIALSRAGWDHF